ncbi:hypothetical protein [Agromyces subbeticus]|uniref:hypothetical protein n=1 Tax=Agromyces subbeticus TaxID=293890 RepID=UPI0003B669A9|nr:hypothetical protein [Agromyces subbeticus]
MHTTIAPAVTAKLTDAARHAADFDVRIDIDPANRDQVLVSVSPVHTIDGPSGAERHTNTCIGTEPIVILAPEAFDGRGGWASAPLVLMDTDTPIEVVDAVLTAVSRGSFGHWVDAV